MKLFQNKSKALFEESRKNLVGGVNSPVRAYRGYDFPPPFIARASGSHIIDVDGNDYIDYVGSWGPMILGHAHPAVIQAVKDAVDLGTSYGAPTEKETELAKMVKDKFPSIELVRFVSSGTEAVMSAIRAARGYTKRDKIIKFNGCYHGHSDFLLVKAGSGAASFGTPDSAGVPADFAKHTLIAEYNDLNEVELLVKNFSHEIAAIIVEPVAGNMGCIPPALGFLQGLRDICDKNGIVLIFDEVITGFRVALGGAQQLYGVKPDLTCLGKILGGGLPMGAYGGQKEIMEVVAPLGSVYQAGTLSGNPVAVSAGIATIKLLNKNLYEVLDKKTEILIEGIAKILKEKDIPHEINRVGSMFTVFFISEKVRSFKDASKTDRNIFDKYFIHMLKNSIYLAPSPYECAFASAAHTDDDIEKTLECLKYL